MADLGPNPPKAYNGYGIIAFLDILGFSNAVWREWPSALSRLLNIKDADGIRTKGITFAVERPQTASSFFIPTIRTFSDSFILLAPWQQRLPPLERIAAFMSITANIRFFWKAAVKQGFVVRGVMEVGNIYWSESDVVGPAAASAIHLEKKADSARIILGPKLLLTLSELEGENNEYGDGWLSTLMKSRDDLIALSPIYFGSADADSIKRIERMRFEAPDEKSKKKYDELLEVLKNPSQIRTPEFLDLIKSAKHLQN